MVAILHDRLSFEVDRVPLELPVPPVLVWGRSVYVRDATREKYPRVLCYYEKNYRVLDLTPRR